MTINPTGRFSSRVENYVKYRPGYPQAVVELLKDECGLTPDSVVADIGSGTGILTELFLRNGNRVVGVEPNREMREAGERLLAPYTNFESVAASAEETTLDDASVDFVVAGQAFHWFDRERARAEFARILRPGGWVALIWNGRRMEASDFQQDYERLLRTFGTDYAEVKHQVGSEDDLIRSFFGDAGFELRVFDNRQVFDFEGLRGRLLSTSYAPEEGHPNYAPMLDEIAALFRRHQAGGRVVFEYETKIFYGHLSEEGGRGEKGKRERG